MSRYWPADPNPAPQQSQTRPPQLSLATIRDRLADIDLGRPHYYVARIFWWALTWAAGAFTLLSGIHGNGLIALQWGTLLAVGLVAQDVVKLERYVDQVVNPRRVDLPRGPSNPQTSTVSADTRHTRLPTRRTRGAL